MRKVICLLLSLFLNTVLFAQRGRARPEDWGAYDYPSSSNSFDLPVGFYFALLAIIIVGIIWFKIVLNRSRNQEIKEKTIFLTYSKTIGSESASVLRQVKNKYYNDKASFVEENNIVYVPQYARCIILEYWSKDHSYVKVKFEDYPKPIYIGRWYLRTPDRLDS